MSTNPQTKTYRSVAIQTVDAASPAPTPKLNQKVSLPTPPDYVSPDTAIANHDRRVARHQRDPSVEVALIEQFNDRRTSNNALLFEHQYPSSLSKDIPDSITHNTHTGPHIIPYSHSSLSNILHAPIPLPYKRAPTHIHAGRVVSLPTRLHDQAVQIAEHGQEAPNFTLIALDQRRVVSMPDMIPTESVMSRNSLYLTKRGPRQIVPRVATPIPPSTAGSRTPPRSLSSIDGTVPSSPESVVFVSDIRLDTFPLDFLRGHSNSVTPHPPERVPNMVSSFTVPRDLTPNQTLDEQTFRASSDSDWVTWANSPPKPIPALHGPPSLPYARCPSGAEGVIFDETTSTKAVWGVGKTTTHEPSVHGKVQTPSITRESPVEHSHQFSTSTAFKNKGKTIPRNKQPAARSFQQNEQSSGSHDFLARLLRPHTPLTAAELAAFERIFESSNSSSSLPLPPPHSYSHWQTPFATGATQTRQPELTNSLAGSSVELMNLVNQLAASSFSDARSSRPLETYPNYHPLPSEHPDPWRNQSKSLSSVGPAGGYDSSTFLAPFSLPTGTSSLESVHFSEAETRKNQSYHDYKSLSSLFGGPSLPRALRVHSLPEATRFSTANQGGFVSTSLPALQSLPVLPQHAPEPRESPFTVSLPPHELPDPYPLSHTHQEMPAEFHSSAGSSHFSHARSVPLARLATRHASGSSLEKIPEEVTKRHKAAAKSEPPRFVNDLNPSPWPEHITRWHGRVRSNSLQTIHGGQPASPVFPYVASMPIEAPKAYAQIIPPFVPKPAAASGAPAPQGTSARTSVARRQPQGPQTTTGPGETPKSPRKKQHRKNSSVSSQEQPSNRRNRPTGVQHANRSVNDKENAVALRGSGGRNRALNKKKGSAGNKAGVKNRLCDFCNQYECV